MTPSRRASPLRWPYRHAALLVTLCGYIRSRRSRAVVRRRTGLLLIVAIAATLFCLDNPPSNAQQLPPGGGPLPPVRRGPDGKIEVIPPNERAPSAPPIAAPPSQAPRAAQPPAAASAAKPNAPPPTPAATAGTRFILSADDLPAPNTTPPNDLEAIGIARPPGLLPQAPKGFSVSLFATGAGNARWLAVAPNGDVFMAASGNGKIMMLRDANGKGVADKITTFAAGFSKPHGMAFHDGAFYVADLHAVWRLPYHDGDTVMAGTPKRVTTAPDLRLTGHWTREIAFDSNGRLYLAIGCIADVADDDPPTSATIQEVKPDGTMTTFASGLRNVVGMAVNPATDELWATINERDKLGGGLPPDYLAHIAEGDFFGWPYAYAGPHPDPVYGGKRPDLVAKTKTPEVLFEAHSAPLGVVFYAGRQFPPEYRGDAFVAFHATGPYGKPDGFKVVRVKFENGRPVGGYEDFVTGFRLADTNPPRNWGAPAGLAVAKDGSLLIADETSVWRVAYTAK
jgi:glucose/arabinose dehydrogenase